MWDGVAARHVAPADVLELAARRLRVAARHYHDRNVSDGCDDAWAAYRHVRMAIQQMNSIAVVHVSMGST